MTRLATVPSDVPPAERAVSLLDREGLTVRVATGDEDEAQQIHALIAAHQEEGRLLPRELSEVLVHATRFSVALDGDRVVGCAELAPLGRDMAEVRSLVVDCEHRGAGVGRRLITDLQHRARREGFSNLCAFTHEPAPFVRLGFSIVPHPWIPEKIASVCCACPQFRRCGKFAVLCTVARRRSP